LNITRKIILDLNNDIYTKIEAKQNDVKSRYIEFTLTNSGVVANLTGHTVKIYAVKSDNTLIFNNVSVTDAVNGKVLVELTSQALAVVGNLNCELVIYGSDSSVLSSKTFVINVLASIRDDGAIESTDEFTALTQGINKLEGWDDQFQAKYDGLNTQYASQLTSNTNKLGILSTNGITEGSVAEAIKNDRIQIDSHESQLEDITNTLPSKANQTDLNTTNTIVGVKADISYVDNKVASVANSTPESFANLAAIQAAYPSGSSYVKLNLTDQYVYKWNGSAWVQGWVYQASIPSDYSLIYKKLKNPIAQVIANTAGTSSDEYVFKVDLQAKTITVLVNFMAIVNQINFLANTQSLNISSVSGGEWACYLNTDTGLIGCGNVYVDTFPVNHLILFYMYKNHIGSINKDLVQVIDATGVDVTSIVKNGSITYKKLKNPIAQILSDRKITMDFQAKNIVVASGGAVVEVDQTSYVIPAQTKDISAFLTSNPTNIHIIYLDTSNNTINIAVDYVSALPSNTIILFYEYLGKIKSSNSNAVQVIASDGSDPFLTDYTVTYKKLETPMASILKTNAIEVNLKTKVLTVNSCLINIPNNKSGDTFVSSHTVDITSVVSDLTKKYTFYYNFSTSKVEFGIYSSNIPISAWVLFTLYQDTLVALNPKSVKLINTSGTEVNLTYNPFDYDETKHRMLLPDDMYFVKDLLLPIYKSSFISNSGDIDIFKTALINIQSDNTPQINYFDENYLLDGGKLNNAFKIAIAQKRNADYDYLKNITKHFVDSVSNVGKTLTHLCIGDSITEHNIAPLLTAKMSNWSVGVTQVGTFNSQEGRSGWRWKNFIGMSNMHADNVTVITRSTSGTTTRYQNPFLKLATASDIANHPDWCFRNTGAETEKSYTEDTDKTGNFYIFDFAWYLSSHGITAPNTITIALGTNDVWHDTDSLANSRLALEIMIKQIKTALPNVKIGVIPSPSWEFNDSQNNNNYWNTKIADWIDNCITDVKNLQSTYSNLYIIGIWAHMSRFFIWDYDTQANLSSINNTQKCHKLDAIHHNDYGKAEYINAMSSWLMNVI
jgi:lysophospholipase L1-like esterase